ncbi:MAG: hypothetical protein WD431_14880, partial [Cyclobacteriaceae bacterium]
GIANPADRVDRVFGYSKKCPFFPWIKIKGTISALIGKDWPQKEWNNYLYGRLVENRHNYAF